MLQNQLTTEERMVLTVDAIQNYRAQELAQVAKRHGAHFLKFGLEVSSAYSWGYCADLAEEYDMRWIADAKLHDTPKTVAQTTKNFATMSYPPYALTIHATSGSESLRAAHESAGTMHLLGVTVLASMSRAESVRVYGDNIEKIGRQLVQDIARVGLSGVVCSSDEVSLIKSSKATEHLTVMTSGVYLSSGSDPSQQYASTPNQLLRAGADLIVLGREVTAADIPSVAYYEFLNSLS